MAGVMTGCHSQEAISGDRLAGTYPPSKIISRRRYDRRGSDSRSGSLAPRAYDLIQPGSVIQIQLWPIFILRGAAAGGMGDSRDIAFQGRYGYSSCCEGTIPPASTPWERFDRASHCGDTILPVSTPWERFDRASNCGGTIPPAYVLRGRFARASCRGHTILSVYC